MRSVPRYLAGNEAACLPSGASLTCDTAGSEAAKSGSKVNLISLRLTSTDNGSSSLAPCVECKRVVQRFHVSC